MRETATYVPSCRRGAEGTVGFGEDVVCLRLGDDEGDVIDDDLGRV